MFETLPFEIREKIVFELSVEDLLNCSLVSKCWRSIVNLDIVWRHHCQKKCFLANTVKELDPGGSPEEVDTSDSDLDPLCQWRKIFSWHNRLRNNWLSRKFRRYKLAQQLCTSPVFSLDSDGTVAVSGHGDSSINVWEVGANPRHVGTIFAVLCSVPVTSVQIWKDYIVLLQKKLLQVYVNNKSSGYALVHAKSFELSVDKMTLMDKVNVLGERFDFWYNECLRVNEESQLNQFTQRRVVFAVSEHVLLGSVGGSDELGVWNISGEVRANLTGIQSIRSIIAKGPHVYIVSGDENTLISKYSLTRNEAEPALRVPGWKKVLLTDDYILAVPNRVDTSLKRIWVWDRNHVLVRTRNLSFGQISVAPASYWVVYSENAEVTVWDPRHDTVLNTFSAGYIIAFIKPAFSTLMIAFANNSVHVWDFMEGKRLYRIYSQLEWVGDFRDQLWLNPSMIITGGVDKQMELLLLEN